MATSRNEQSAELFGLLGVASFRLLVDPQQPGARNMAVDDALLRSMAAGGDPVLRLYGFSPPCLSLGRFQSAADLGDAELRRRDRIALVRRPTGGRAVLHDAEVTYAVILGRAHLKPFTKRAAYRASAALLRHLLAALGVRAAVQTARSAPSPTVDPDCYRTTGEYEITATGGRKLVGSAQTTSREAALQHGTIPLSASYAHLGTYLRNPSSTELAATSIAQETGRRWTYEEAVRVLATAATTRLNARSSVLSTAESGLARELEQTRYACPEWTYAR